MAKKNQNTDSLYLNKLVFDKGLYKSVIYKLFSNTRVVFLAVFALLLAGISSFLTLPQELNPEVNISIVTVVTTLPGANPLDVEELITKKIEKEISTLSEVNNLSSSSQESLSIVTAEFTSTTNPDDALQKAKEKVDLVADLPEDASTPRLSKLDFTNEPVLQVALVGESDRRSLSKIAKKLQDKLEDNSSIGSVSITGDEVEEVSVSLKPESMAAYDVTAEQVIQSISTTDVNIPSGSVQVNNTDYQVTVDTTFTDISKLRSLPINVGALSVPLGEIADVYFTSSDSDQFAYFVQNNSPRKNAIKLTIYKTETATITDAAELSLSIIDEEMKSFPELEPVTILDTSDLIQKQFGELGINFRDTIILVFLTLFIFLGFKQAAIASLSIPLTFLSTFTIMRLTGFSLNFLSLFSLLLSLGLVVDDAIVIVQASHRYGKKFKPMEMGMLVFRDFVVPIWTTTLTTVWAFLPLLLSTGIIGEFIKSIPVVVSATLLSSTTIAVLINLPLVVTFSQLTIPRRVKMLFGGLIIGASLFILSTLGSNSPWLIGVILSWLVGLVLVVMARKQINILASSKLKSAKENDNFVSRFLEKVKNLDLINNGLLDFSVVTKRYRRVLRKILLSRSRRFGVYGLVTIFFITSVAFLVTGLLKNEFFPKQDQEQIYINIEGPPGWQLERTNQVLQQVEAEIIKIPELKYAITQTGGVVNTSGGGSLSGAGGAGSHLGYVTLVLPAEEDRDRKSGEISEELRSVLAENNQAKITVQEASGGPPVGADIQVNIKGDDLIELEQVSEDFVEILESIEGAVNADTSLKQNAGQIKVVLNEQELLERGLRPAQIGSWLRTAITGFESGDITLDTDDLDIVVNINKDEISLGRLQNMTLPSQFGSYTLGEVASFSLETSPSVVNRADQKRVVRATAAARGISTPELLAAFEEKSADYVLPDGVTWDVGGANEENQKSTLSIIQAMGVSIILILVTMVVQLNSFRKSLIVLVVIPLAVAGVFFNFTLLGVPLSFAALIGVLALFGIVVNNSIMLVEKINQNIAFGLPFTDAVVDACSSRVEAIFFTSVTTTIGLLPITIADPFWRGLGGAIIAGLSVSGLLILFLLPAMYVEIYRNSEGKSQP
jgi:multidrug efflux pump subunit AcrB